MNLQDLGWDAFFADAFQPYEGDNLIPARVAARHHGPCELLTELGRLGGIPAGKLGDDELPAVGDWVAVRPLDGERKAVIEAVLPRRSSFSRKEAWKRTTEQIVAANVDTVFLVTAFGAVAVPVSAEVEPEAARVGTLVTGAALWPLPQPARATAPRVMSRSFIRVDGRLVRFTAGSVPV